MIEDSSFHAVVDIACRVNYVHAQVAVNFWIAGRIFLSYTLKVLSNQTVSKSAWCLNKHYYCTHK